MSNQTWSPEEFRGKVDSEGGWYDAVAGYGMNEDYLDPELATPEQIAAVRQFRLAAEELRELEDAIDKLFPDWY